MQRLRALAVLLVLVAARPAAAGDGQLVWRTIETDHFVVHYYEPNEDVARRVAVAAERAHRTLVPALRYAPPEKTQVVVTDDTDGANGFAGVVPRNVIHIFATAPGGTSTLNDHDDWLYGLVAHEYAHILHLDTIHGLPRWYNKLFGKTWAPNQIQPRWFIEGLATYQESKRTSSGRTRSAIFDMYLRVPVLAGHELRLDHMSTGPLRFPHGNTAYLYGSHFLKYIADRYGDDVIAAISHEFGRQPVPFGLNRAVKRAVGKTYVELYDEWVEAMRERYRLQEDAVRRRGVREGRRLTTTGESNANPRYTPDGASILWSRSDGRSRGQLRAMPVGGDGSESRLVAAIDNASAYALLPDGSGLVVERGNVFRTNYDVGDLYRYDFATGEITRLTRGLRAHDPDVSHDGRRVALTVNGRSRLKLAVLDLDAAEPVARVLWEGPARWDQAFTPRWSPDDRRIAFSAWTQGGYRDLWLYDLERGRAERLTHDRAIDGEPTWSPDGRWIFFSSDRSGIYNIYAIDPDTREMWQVTNVIGGAFSPDVSPDGRRLVYMGFDVDGHEIYEIELDRAAWLAPEPFVNDRPDPVALADDEVVVSRPRPYRPIETLAPNAYTLQLGADTHGDAVTIATSGSDVVGLHAYAMGATYGFSRGDVTFAASYAYNRYWPSLRFAVGRGLGRPGGLFLDNRNTRYTEEIWSANASVGLPVLRVPGMSSDLVFGYGVDWLRNLDPVPEPDPNAAVTRPPETGVLAGVSLRWTLSAMRRYRYIVGPAEGRALSFGIRLSHPAIGSDWESVELSWRWQEYVQMPWSRDHVLSLRLVGGIEHTTRRRDGAFTLGSAAGPQDIFDAIINSQRVGNTWLHGYPPASLRGRQFHMVNAEYRFPLATFERGLDTMPIYVRRLHAAALVDAATATFDDFDPAEIRYAVGASLRLDVVFGWFAPGSFDLGWARGLSTGGVSEWWFLLTGSL